MGWLFPCSSRDELIGWLTRPSESDVARYETISHTLLGHVLWSVVRIAPKMPGIPAGRGDPPGVDTFIVCHLLACADSRWGYKSMDERAAPYAYNCPLNYLDMAPEQSREWRKGVRAFHARRCSKAPPPSLPA